MTSRGAPVVSEVSPLLVFVAPDSLRVTTITIASGTRMLVMLLAPMSLSLTWTPNFCWHLPPPHTRGKMRRRFIGRGVPALMLALGLKTGCALSWHAHGHDPKIKLVRAFFCIRKKQVFPLCPPPPVSKMSPCLEPVDDQFTVQV